MALASTSLLQMAYVKETVFGVTPGAGTSKALRITGESLDFNVSKEESQEINAARAPSSVIAVGAAAGGGVQAELSYREYDDMLEGIMMSTWAAYGTAGVGTTFTGTFTATTITADVAPTGANAFTTLKKGQWFKLNTGGVNNGKFFRVSKTTAPTTTVITLDTNTPATVGAAVANCSVATSRLTNGITQSSFTLEQQILGTSPVVYKAFRGMVPDKMALAIASAARSTINFDYMGKDSVINDTATTLPGVLQASQSYDIHSSVSGASACQLWYGGAPLTGTYVKSLSLEYGNSSRAQDAMCTLGAVGIGTGQISASINASIYFADKAIYQDFLDNAYPELSFSSLDPSGNGYFFTLPRANLSTAKVNAGGRDQDMMLDVTFRCVRDAANADATLRQVLFIDRVGAAAV